MTLSRFRLVSRLAGALGTDRNGLATIELALAMPFVLLLGLGGVEMVNYLIVQMRMGQIAVALADNASRAKEDVVSGVPRVREADVNEAFAAALVQSGDLDIEANGRLILSSLEVNSDGGQWIHWQRCFGQAPYSSSYGEEGDGASGIEMTGMGPPGRQVQAERGFPLMFAEVAYEFRPLFFGRFTGSQKISKVAAMFVRDNRDLSGIYNPEPVARVSACD